VFPETSDVRRVNSENCRILYLTGRHTAKIESRQAELDGDIRALTRAIAECVDSAAG
jgi:hypothetical protein